jgi:hypothetical protein
MRKTAICAITAAVLLLQGCAATQVALGKRDLDVQTKMSATVFLDPVPPEQMTVFVQVRNTSDRQDLDIAEDVKNAVIAKGYRVVRDPKLAKYYLQANILFVGKTSPTAIQQQTGRCTEGWRLELEQPAVECGRSSTLARGVCDPASCSEESYGRNWQRHETGRRPSYPQRRRQTSGGGSVQST